MSYKCLTENCNESINFLNEKNFLCKKCKNQCWSFVSEERQYKV